MLVRTIVSTLILSVCGSTMAADTPPIAELSVRPNQQAFKDSNRKKPLVLKSAEDAKPYFAEKALEALGKAVDFDEQVVLVFAWRGSGQDKLDYAVAESFPEQIFYTYKPGRTRDLRPHVCVHALRKNVKWQVK